MKNQFGDHAAISGHGKATNNRRGLDPDYVKAEIEARFPGARVVGRYTTSLAPLACICPKGHECSPSWGNIKRGQGMCLVCGGRAPLNPDFVRRYIEENFPGTRVLGEYRKNSTPISCICPQGHECSPSWVTIQAGCGICRKCGSQRAAEAMRLDPGWVKSEIERRFPGAQVVGEYMNANMSIACICPQGHVCNPRWGNIAGGGGMCRECTGGKAALGPDFVRDRMEEMFPGLKVVGEYVNAITPIACICPQGHPCAPAWNGLQQGRGPCLECGKVLSAAKRRLSGAWVKSEIERLFPGAQVLGKYVNALTVIECVCPQGHSCCPNWHGIQQGKGLCNTCARSGYSDDSPGFLYLIDTEVVEPFGVLANIGISNSLHIRLQQHANRGFEWQKHYQAIQSDCGRSIRRLEADILQALADSGIPPIATISMVTDFPGLSTPTEEFWWPTEEFGRGQLQSLLHYLRVPLPGDCVFVSIADAAEYSRRLRTPDISEGREYEAV